MKKEPKSFKYPRLYMRYIKTDSLGSNARMRIIYPNGKCFANNLSGIGLDWDCNYMNVPCWQRIPKSRISVYCEEDSYTIEKNLDTLVYNMKRYDKLEGFETLFICELR